MIPKEIKIKNGELPDEAGVYFYYDKKGRLLYIGKATSLKRRVGSYFNKAHDPTSPRLRGAGARIERLVSEIARIDYLVVPTVIEALVLEANQIRAHKPPYNVELKDDKSFIYLAITNEKYPRPLLVRGLELERMRIDPFTFCHPEQRRGIIEAPFLHLFGPFMSAKTLRTALDLLRPIISWSDCMPGQKRPCFNAQIGKCPGVCTGLISSREYKKTIRELVLFFSGKKTQLIRKLKREMETSSKAQNFEKATILRNRLFALEHIRDVALLTREETTPYLVRKEEGFVNLNGRIEAYDISNISGTSAVGSMVVFENGKPAKDKYRKFKIKTVKGANDVAMMEEVMRRRLIRANSSPKAWPLPEVMVIDGGEPQVNRVREVFESFRSTFYVLHPPIIIGIAKGFDRKQDQLVYDRHDAEAVRVAERGKELFQKARDEAHRFAVRYHRTLRGKKFLLKKHES